MLDRVIRLKRNSFILHLLVFFPLVFIFAILSLILQYLELGDWRKIFLFCGFVLQLIISYNIIQSNKLFIIFTEQNVSLYGYKHRRQILLKQFSFESIKNVICDEKRKTIKLIMHNMTQEYLLNFEFSKLIGEEIFFKVKSELCRYFPTKTKNLRDEYVEYYLKHSDEIPQIIVTRQRSEYYQAIVLLFFEFILAVIPMGLMFLSVAWVCCKIWILIFKFIIFMLNLFAK